MRAIITLRFGRIAYDMPVPLARSAEPAAILGLMASNATLPDGTAEAGWTTRVDFLLHKPAQWGHHDHAHDWCRMLMANERVTHRAAERQR